MNILAACGGAGLAGAQGRLQVLGALLRLRARRPRLLHRGDAPPAPAAHADRAGHRRGRARRRARSRERNPRRDRDRAALRQRPRPGPRARATRRCSRCRPCRRSSASTRATSSSPRTTSPACSSTRRATTCPASTTRPATACSCSRRSRRCSASRSRRCCRRGAPGIAAGALRRAGAADPARDAAAAALRPRARQPQAQGGRLRVPRDVARDRPGVRRAPAHARAARRAPGEGYQYEREVEEFLRWSPAVRGDDRLGLGRLSRDQLAELARALESLPSAPGAPGAARTRGGRRHVAHRLALLLGRRGRRRSSPPTRSG